MKLKLKFIPNVDIDKKSERRESHKQKKQWKTQKIMAKRSGLNPGKNQIRE